MYFDKSNKFNIEKYINNSDKIYAHTMDDYKKVETLKEHLERSIKYFYKLVENKI